jgi:hypothetical protein
MSPRHGCALAACALGFLDCNDISARCMLTIFQFFATKTGAGEGRRLNGDKQQQGKHECSGCCSV